MTEDKDMVSVARLRESMRQLARKLGIVEKGEAGCCGVTLSQCHALIEIGRSGALALNDLAEVIGLDKSTVSRTVNGLVDQGLAVRKSDPEDRRYISIQLTEAGEEAFQTIEDTMNEYYAAVYAALPADKREQVLESLILLLEAIPGTCC